jgi:hypothetical protein
MKNKTENKMRLQKLKIFVFIFLEVSLVLLFLFLFLFPKTVFAGFGTNNVTLITNLTVGTSAPIINQISIDQGSVVLLPNSQKTVNCTVIVEDYDGEADIENVTAKFFYPAQASLNSPDDNNNHYTNDFCIVNKSYGNEYQAIAHCLFDVWYYATAGSWNCSVTVNDSIPYYTNGSNITTIQPLLALGLPDFIDYGTVNATYVSGENISNVTNYGNVKINLSLSGYGFRINDGNAMNCTLGSVKNISIQNEKYNLTNSNSGDSDLTGFIANYTNTTSNPIVRTFNLDYRHNDTLSEAWNQTYWRIYVPLGVAGTCQGNIVFGAVQANGV